MRNFSVHLWYNNRHALLIQFFITFSIERMRFNCKTKSDSSRLSNCLTSICIFSNSQGTLIPSEVGVVNQQERILTPNLNICYIARDIYCDVGRHTHLEDVSGLVSTPESLNALYLNAIDFDANEGCDDIKGRLTAKLTHCSFEYGIIRYFLR